METDQRGQNWALFDSNIWRHLDSDGLLRLRHALRRHGLVGASSPIVVDELVRTSDVTLRDAMIKLACRPSWKRLMPVAHLDADQIIAAIRTHRPAWLRSDPDVRRWNYEKGAYLSDGPSSFWTHVADRTDVYARAQEPNVQIREEQAATTRSARTLVPVWDRQDVAAAMSAPVVIEVEGSPLRGTPVEVWRYQAARTIANDLRPGVSEMYRMWFGCHLELNRISNTEWWEFWAHEITPMEASRLWSRCAFFHLQAARSTKGGVAGDLALSTHLVDVALVLTLDKAFAGISQRIRAAAPFRTAQVVQASTFDLLIEQLNGYPPRTMQN